MSITCVAHFGQLQRIREEGWSCHLEYGTGDRELPESSNFLGASRHCTIDCNASVCLCGLGGPVG